MALFALWGIIVYIPKHYYHQLFLQNVSILTIEGGVVVIIFYSVAFLPILSCASVSTKEGSVI